MMMPANFSVMAENELTYIVGGSAVTDAVKTFNTNVVTIIGNSYVNKLIGATLGTMFNGSWGDVGLFDHFADVFYPEKQSALNSVMQTVGIGAAVYQLGTASTGSTLSAKNKAKAGPRDEEGNVIPVTGKQVRWFGVDGNLHSYLQDMFDRL